MTATFLIAITIASLATGLLTKVVAEVTTPGCSDPVLATPFTNNNENLAHLVPLGNISPPAHNLATGHIYYTLKRGFDNVTLKTKLMAPADVRVERISYISDTRDGKLVAEDYKISMVPCKQVAIYFDHIQQLSPKLENAWKEGNPRCSESTFGANNIGRYCDKDVNLNLKSGEGIGFAGEATPTGWDFGATDKRVPPLQFANPARYRKNELQTICPIDLFPSTMKQDLYQFFGNERRKRTEEPICGAIMQDVVGTAQGNWFDGKGSANDLEKNQKTLALIHDNFDPKMGIFVVNSQALGAVDKKLTFTPKNSGTINREFSEVKSGDLVYCYQDEGVGYAPPGTLPLSLLIRLKNEGELEVATKNSACESNSTLTNSHLFTR